jgi:hypothetical protein
MFSHICSNNNNKDNLKMVGRVQGKGQGTEGGIVREGIGRVNTIKA